jgi:hypothetical protein
MKTLMTTTEKTIFSIIESIVCPDCPGYADGCQCSEGGFCYRRYRRQATEIYQRVVRPLEDRAQGEGPGGASCK